MPDISRRRLLQGAGTAAAAAFAAEFLPSNVRKALAAGPSRGGSIRDIKHVVILMQENRSFDHYFGTLPNVRGFSDPNAITLSSGQKVWYQPDTSTITPSGSTVYVADENSNSVDVISTATGRVTGSIAVQGLPMSIAATPDGSQVWVGNGYTGSISVISTATNAVTDTISGGGQATALNSATTAIAFGPAAS